MILNCSQRTDIPAFFSDWFYRRIAEGYVLARNPYNPKQVTRYQLDPELVDCLCFSTKNPGPMLDRLELLKSFRQFWFVTITAYENEIEPRVPDKKLVRQSFKLLSQKVGIDGVEWRYDPIFLSSRYSLARHLETFEEYAQDLSGFTRFCTISFIDLFQKTKRNFPQAKSVSFEDQLILGEQLAKIGKRYGIDLKSCAEGDHLARFGIDTRGCMVKEVLERALKVELTIRQKIKAREACDCLLGNDIGAYNSCPHACLYCYANVDQQAVIQNFKLHDPLSPFLIGGACADDRVTDAKQVSYITGQLHLF